MPRQAARHGFDHQTQAVAFVARIHAAQGKDGAFGLRKQHSRVGTGLAMTVHHPCSG